MFEYVDKTLEKKGTPLNRKTFMALQGFIQNTTQFSGDTIIEENADGQVLTTTFNSDGTIIQTFVGEKTITKTTMFGLDTVTEVIS